MPEFHISPESQQAIQREVAGRQRAFTQARARVTEQQAERLAYVQQYAPTASNQLKDAYASTSMSDEQLVELAQREAAQRPAADDGGLLADIGNVLNGAGMAVWNQVAKPVVRGTFTLWDGMQEELISRPLTSIITAQDPDVSFGEAYQQYGDSAFRNIVQGDLPSTDAEGNPIEGGSLGHGLFPGGQAQAQSERERTLQIDGHRGDLGRAIAHGIWADEGGLLGDMYGPGDSAYDITAGVSQFLGEVVLDPVAWGTAGAATAIKAGKGVTGGSRTLGSAFRTVSVRNANDAAQQVKTAGLVAGNNRNTVLLDQAQRIFKNRKVLDEIAQADEYTIYRRMKMDRLGLGRGDDRMAKLITDLGATSTREEAAEVLLEAAQRGWVRERGFYKGAGKFVPNPKEKWGIPKLSRDFRMEHNLPEFRFGGDQPARVVSADNKMESARTIDDVLRLAKVGEKDRAQIVSRAFRASGGDEMMQVRDEAIRAIGRKTQELGVSREQAAKLAGQDIDELPVDMDVVDILLKSSRDEINHHTGYLLDQVGQPSPPPWKGQAKMVLPDGTEVDTASISAGLIVNANKRALPMPDAQDLRRATTKYSAMRDIYQSNGWEMASSATRWGTRFLFKFPTLFTRFAYPVRNNLENAGRIAGAGYNSVFSNARAFFGMGVLDRNKFRDMMQASDGVISTGRGIRMGGRYHVVDEVVDEGTDNALVRFHDKESGEAFERPLSELSNEVDSIFGSQDEWALKTGALTHDASGMWKDDGAKKLGTWRTFRKGEQGDVKAWRNQLGRLRNDPIAQRVADTDKYLDRDELIDDILDNGLVDEVIDTVGGEEARRFFKGGGVDPDRRQVAEYVDWVEGHIDNLTGGDMRLRRMLATGDLNGVNFNDIASNRRIDQILREQYYGRMPMEVNGDDFVEDANRTKRLFKGLTDGLVDFMATRPENHFTRYPLLTQVFADDIAASMPTLADDTLRREMVRRAADAGFEGKDFDHIAQAAQKAAGQKGVATDLDDVIDAAKIHSTDKTLEIAFDASNRSSFQEAFDAFVPFWDAFAEIGKSWGRIARDNPNVLGRGMQTFQAGQNSGFIYTNEMGEEVFAMPGGGALAKMLGMGGVGKPLMEAPVEGLNLITQGFGPGVGPLVQWGVGAFMPDTPDLQWARDILTPYGSSVEAPSDLVNPANYLNDLTPAWIKKATNAFTKGDIDPVAWNSSVGNNLKVLATSGRYDMSDPESVRQLHKDAEKGARWTMFLRSALQMGAPTGPGVAWEIQTDPDGTTHRVQTMANAYYDMYQESGDQVAATQAFIEMYGVEPFWIAQGKTNELVEGPRTREGLNWIGRHGEAAERHPDVVGYFVPAEDPNAPPDYGVYRQRLESGELESLTGEQQLALANKTKARTIMSVWQQRAEGLPSGQRTRMLSTIRDSLNEMYPGWNSDVLGVSSKLDRDQKIARLMDAVQDEALADSPVTEPLSLYLRKRQEAMSVLAQREAAGQPKTLAAQANEDVKRWLHNIGQELSVRSPHFQGVWQSVLSTEVDA